jgi:ribonuclease HI
VRELAALMGKVNFLHWQFPRISLYTSTMNRTKVRGVKREGWNGKARMTYAARNELTVILRWVKKNTPRNFQTSPPQASLVTDASGQGWGAVLEIGGEKSYYLGEFRNQLKNLTSSNQRETAAVMLALKETVNLLKMKEVRVLCIESDNITTVSNIANVRAAKSMLHIARRIFLTSAKTRIELVAKYRPGIANTKADALSRLEAAGDYSLKEQIFWKGLENLKTETENEDKLVTIDIFATARNTKLPRYISPEFDPLAVASDAFSVQWQGEKVYAHPPVILITQTLRRIEQERVEAVVVVPCWQSQPWWPLWTKLVKKETTLGESELILERGVMMNMRKTKLPPGQLIMGRISWMQ